ncbi:unnamed protein product, partial [Prorocentrum cordatum]
GLAPVGALIEPDLPAARRRPSRRGQRARDAPGGVADSLNGRSRTSDAAAERGRRDAHQIESRALALASRADQPAAKAHALKFAGRLFCDAPAAVRGDPGASASLWRSL